MNIGDTVFVKTSNEEVFILGLTGNKSTIPAEINVIESEIGPFSGTTAIVRRPSLGQDGVNHVIDFFLIEELETLEDRVRRDKTQQDRVRKTLEAIDVAGKATAAEIMN